MYVYVCERPPGFFFDFLSLLQMDGDKPDNTYGLGMEA